MTPIESTAAVFKEKTTEQEAPHIVHDNWETSLSLLEETEIEGNSLHVALIAVLIFIIVVFCVVLI